MAGPKSCYLAPFWRPSICGAEHTWARGMLFYRLVQQAVECDPVPYRALVGGKRADSHNM